MKRLIYMDDTMDKLRAYAERKHNAGYIELANGILKAVNYIHNNIVRVDAVEVVHGRWIEHIEIGAMNNHYECSSCNWKTPSFTIAKNSNYCPNCGAKMDGGAKNVD